MQNSSGQNNWHLGGSVMLYLSLQGMETIILKRDTLTKNIKQIALWSSFKKKKKKKTHFLEVSTKHFIHGYSSVRTTHNWRY